MYNVEKMCEQGVLKLFYIVNNLTNNNSAEDHIDFFFIVRGSPPVSAVVTSFKDLMLDDEKSGAKPKQTTSAHNTSPSVPNRDFTTIR